MNDKEIEQLLNLAASLMQEASKKDTLTSFVAAGILTQEGEFTEPYNELNSVDIPALAC